jgi:hypothetical protein
MSQITVKNLVSHRTHEGIVAIEFDGKPIGQLDVESAYKLSRDISECAAVAELEASLFGYLRGQCGLSLDQAANFIADFRRKRG